MSLIPRRSFAVAAAAACLAWPAKADTPYGYAGNAGWIGFGPPTTEIVHSGASYLAGFAYGANFGWIDFGDGTPATGTTYSNTSANDCGVNHDGFGALSGYAYGANVGWINFSWAGANDPNRPRVDLVTGKAAGYAYGANIGWINLNELTMPGVTASIRFSSGSTSSVAGSLVTLRIAISGSESLSFQWLINDIPIPGATGPIYTLPSAQNFHSGDYTVQITRADGSTYGVAPTALAVVAPQPNNARLMNLSTRALDLTGDNVLIPGFVVSGSGSKRVLIRGVGPTLASFGVSDTLVDPQMNVVNSTGIVIATNDDWGTNSNKAAIIATAATVGAFPLIEGSKDAALLLDLPPGSYTVPTSGVADGTGVAIVELYDADTSTPTATLVNISNRGFVGVGDNVMIPGIVVSNEGPRTFLLRAVGPTLAGFGVDGTLADPVLTVFSGDTAILTNDDWGNPQGGNTADVAAQVGAFSLSPGSKDAAFVVTLQPGAYTVQATGKEGTTGVALVEVYLVP